MSRKQATAYAFLDTNVFLEFKDFDQVDWPSVLGYREVCLIIAPIIMTEMEAFKYDRNSHRRQQRSRSLTKKIGDIAFSVASGMAASVHNRPATTLLLLVDSPKGDAYPGLNLSINDDNLIASVLDYIELNPSIHRTNVVIVSDDRGLLTKARARSIEIHLIDNALRLPDETSKEQKEIAALKRRIEEMERCQPTLKLTFDTSSSQDEHLEIQLGILEPLEAELVNELCQRESQTTHWHPPEESMEALTETSKQQTTKHGSDLAATISDFAQAVLFNPLESIADEEVERYKNQRTQYLKSFRQYIPQLYAWAQRNSRSLQVNLSLQNGGTLPAQNITVFLIVPDPLQVVDPDDLPGPPDQPRRPVMPRTRSEMLSASLHLPSFMQRVVFPISPTSGDFERPNVSYPRIKPFNSTRIEWECERVAHNLPVPLTPIVLEFPAILDKQQYELQYTLHADNIPTPIQGILTIVVQGTPRKIDFVNNETSETSNGYTGA